MNLTQFSSLFSMYAMSFLCWYLQKLIYQDKSSRIQVRQLYICPKIEFRENISAFADTSEFICAFKVMGKNDRIKPVMLAAGFICDRTKFVMWATGFICVFFYFTYVSVDFGVLNYLLLTTRNSN